MQKAQYAGSQFNRHWRLGPCPDVGHYKGSTYTRDPQPTTWPTKNRPSSDFGFAGGNPSAENPLGSLADRLLTACGSPPGPGPRILDPELLTEHFRIPDHTHPLQQQRNSKPIIGCGPMRCLAEQTSRLSVDHCNARECPKTQMGLK